MTFTALETDSLSFVPVKLKAGKSYTFFCSFPGEHQEGTLQLAR